MRVLRWAATLLCVLPAALVAQAQPPAPLAGIDGWIESAMADWNVPGVSIAVVQGDSVVYARGFGVREVGRPEPVDEYTLFGVMSTTKAFTSAAVGMLVDEGLVDWDDPLTRHLPDFRLPDPWVTREFTVRDMLSHRSGLERGDFLWFGSGFDRAQLVHQLRYVDEIGPFRATYGYSNNLYITAGEMVARVSGTTWDDFIDRRIFAPLGMIASNTSVVDLHDAGNVARPHEELGGRLTAIAYRSLDNEAPGGAINSSAWDMAQWVRLQLADGVYDGERLISERALEETRTPQTIVPFSDAQVQTNPGMHFLFYAMGWTVQDYRGALLVQHSGGIDGLRSRVAMLPEHDVGVVILTNKGSWSSLHDVIRNRVLDAYLGADPVDWSRVFLDDVEAQRADAAAADQARRTARVTGTRPSLPLDRYTGAYENEAFGEAHVRMEGDRLVVQVGPSIMGVLEHWHHDTFRVNWGNPYLGWSLVDIDLDAAGHPTSLTFDNWWPEYRRAGGRRGGG
jgi:CubicO group peptidase (beta-lactamase class C family)